MQLENIDFMWVHLSIPLVLGCRIIDRFYRIH